MCTMRLPVALIQSCRHTKASTVVGINRLRKSDIILDPVLKADSDAIVEAGTANMSLAMRLSVDTQLNSFATMQGC